MKKNSKKLIFALLCSTGLMCSAYGEAESSFIVRKIKVEGLQRVSTGTVLNYLPVQIGEEIESDATAQIIKELYETGFFQSVELERQGSTLIVKVTERPTIGSIDVNGNKEIPRDKMKELLKGMGLVSGQVFQRSSLERLEKELKQSYNARGNYNVRVLSNVKNLPENRVAIAITISEGRVSRIKEIKFIGNHDFSSSELMSQLTLSTSSFFSYFNKKDQYSKTAIESSLEAIRSFYLNRGYLKFNIISSQVLLSPDKKDVFINIHLEEGPQYRFGGYEVAGRPMLSPLKMKTLIQVKKGDIFSRKKVTESVSALGLALGDIGYGFPAINAVPRVDEKEKTVFITFMVEPGRHVYVRRINFHGNTKTGDYVLRNVIRQDEGALLSLHNIKESERKLRLLGYLKNIDIKTTPVVGTNNQVDLDVEVEEAPSAEATASLGYGTNGPQANATFNQHNFMGTGRSLGVGVNANYWGRDYSLTYYNPFYTSTGIGRGLNFYYQTIDPTKLDVSRYSSDRFGGDMNYNILLGENSSLQLGYGYQDIQIRSVGSILQMQNFVSLYGRNFNEARLMAGWNRNSYDQSPFPTSGVNQQATGLIALPLSSDSLSYYKTSYQTRWYQPITRGFILSTLGSVGYGNMLNGHGLPFFENYFAGGISQPGPVRGYESYSLGSQDTHHNALGGNFLVNGSAGIILPYPFSRDNMRTAVFTDAGNVFSSQLPLLLQGTGAGPIRYSAGVSLEWQSPFGPLAFSLAKALNKQPLDKTQAFQFTLASAF